MPQSVGAPAGRASAALGAGQARRAGRPSSFPVRSWFAARVSEEGVVGLTGSGLQYIVVDPTGAVDLADHIDGHPGAVAGCHGDMNADAGHGSRRPDPRDVRPPRGVDDQDGFDARLGRWPALEADPCGKVGRGARGEDHVPGMEVALLGHQPEPVFRLFYVRHGRLDQLGAEMRRLPIPGFYNFWASILRLAI